MGEERTAEEKLVCGLEHWGVQLSAQQLEQLHQYYENLVRWNAVMNLTAITEEADVYEKHFLDSLSLSEVVKDSSSVRRVIDVGTGAGFPGLVLAIAYPAWQITLMDSLNKRIRFLEDTAALLKLENVRCIHARAEELGHDRKEREQYDLAISRAVAKLSVLSEYCLPFVKLGGTFVAYKSATSAPELEAASEPIKKLGGSDISLDRMTLPASDIERIFAIVKKERNTPKGFPRKAGVPSKTPLQ